MIDKVPENKISFNKTFKVTTKDIDSRGHVNNLVYLQWTQDIANLHWEVLSNDDLNKNIMWFVLRHEIDYLSQAFIDDTITVYTWIEDVKGARSSRMFRIYRGEELMARCKTVWCLVDAHTHKPKRIGEDIMCLFVPKIE